MKHLVWFLLRHDRLPRRPWLRRWMLQSIFKPTTNSHNWGDIEGWYDLGPDMTPEQAERFKEWERDGQGQ